MFKETGAKFDYEVTTMAKNNVVKRLRKQGLLPDDLEQSEFDELVDMEKVTLKQDTKKVGAGIAIGLGISILSGGIF